MRIEHVAIWTKDIERLRSFYETYFQASAGPRYVNERKQFSSYFLSFASGARLEIMVKPQLVPGSGNADASPTGPHEPEVLGLALLDELASTGACF